MATVDLQLRDIYKNFGAFKALGGVSLDIAAGGLMCLLGLSGCCKTNWLYRIAGLKRQDTWPEEVPV